jgi:hypothetical protein
MNDEFKKGDRLLETLGMLGQYPKKIDLFSIS